MFFRKISSYFTKQNRMSSNLKFYILNGILFTAMSSLSKSYATKFLDRLGGNEFHISLFNALPGLIAVFTIIPGMLWISQTSNRKWTIAKLFFSSRLFIIGFAIVPFLSPIYRPLLFVLLASLQNFPESITVTALQSYTGDIFVQGERSNAIALRNKFSTLAQLIFMLIMGQILTVISDAGNSIIINVYQIFFVIAFVIGLVEIVTFLKLKEIKCHIPNVNLDIKKDIIDIFKNKKFNGFLCCSLLFHFGWQMGWPLFTIYQIKDLGANEWWLTILNLSSNIAMLVSYSYWNKLIKTKGNPYVITFATLGMSLTPILYAVSYNLYIMTFMGVITGFFTSGTVVVILSSLLEVVPEKKRDIYVAMHATLTSITLAVAPMVGNFVLGCSSIYIALIVTSIFRSIGGMAFYFRNKRIKAVT